MFSIFGNQNHNLKPRGQWLQSKRSAWIVRISCRHWLARTANFGRDRLNGGPGSDAFDKGVNRSGKSPDGHGLASQANYPKCDRRDAYPPFLTCHANKHLWLFWISFRRFAAKPDQKHGYPEGSLFQNFPIFKEQREISTSPTTANSPAISQTDLQAASCRYNFHDRCAALGDDDGSPVDWISS